ncbi:hypothetical protein PROFUN_12274 [Planoprotostelium fungivorum]|uniref:Uncharacterized protein n=1 Tax=Planoprotostelium fungivorum TaxID=1890364 RepID=A0A2P6N7R8_9EUKA|nr:hypothetical protein PROFUN_12274 [Planoprotostelium fungivorum]
MGMVLVSVLLVQIKLSLFVKSFQVITADLENVISMFKLSCEEAQACSCSDVPYKIFGCKLQRKVFRTKISFLQSHIDAQALTLTYEFTGLTLPSITNQHHQVIRGQSLSRGSFESDYSKSIRPCSTQSPFSGLNKHTFSISFTKYTIESQSQTCCDPRCVFSSSRQSFPCQQSSKFEESTTTDIATEEERSFPVLQSEDHHST